MEDGVATLPIEFGASALEAGFVNGTGGAHDSKTMMLPELRALLAAMPGKASIDEYRRAAVDDNVLDKRTGTTRVKTFAYLRKLYALDGAVPVFAALRDLWPLDADAQPLIAVQCAVARDPLLRATLPVIVSLHPGDVTGPAQLAAAVGDAIPDRYNASVLHHIGQNTGATWARAGLLTGVITKTRIRATATGPAVTYALYLGHLEGLHGPALFASSWMTILGLSPSQAKGFADGAAASGWLDLKSAGGMVEISFSHLDSLARRSA